METNFVAFIQVMVSCIGLAVQIVMLLTLRIAIAGLKKTELQRSLDAITWVSDYMEKIRTHEKYAFSESNPTDQSNIQSAHLREMSIGYQQICFLIRTGALDRELALEMFGLAIVINWRKLENHVRLTRRMNGEPESLHEGAFSRKDFEKIATEFEQELKNRKYIFHTHRHSWK